MSNRRLTAAGLAAVLLLAPACGAKKDSEKEKDKKEFGTAADLSTCKADAKPVARPYPSGFPESWKFPPQTVVFNAEDRGKDGTIVSAVTSTPFKQVLAFLNGPVQAAGYKVLNGETEAHDAEANWKGNQFHGRWAIRESATCSGETVIQVLSAADTSS